MLKILSGQFARQKLELPPRTMTRPVGEKARGAIFNMLAEEIVGARVLDMYAGSGALGLEALSRGAQRVDFVEKHGRVAGVLERNIDVLGVGDSVQIFTRTVEQFLRHIKSEYDIVLMDPPYKDFDPAIVEQAGDLLQCDGSRVGILVVSTSSKLDFGQLRGLNVVRQKVYGDSMLTVLTKNLP